jgi:hypothetical protein
LKQRRFDKARPLWYENKEPYGEISTRFYIRPLDNEQGFGGNIPKRGEEETYNEVIKC